MVVVQIIVFFCSAPWLPWARSFRPSSRRCFQGVRRFDSLVPECRSKRIERKAGVLSSACAASTVSSL